MKTNCLCFTRAYPDFKSALLDLGFSGQLIKRYLNNSQRNLPIKAGQVYQVPVDLLQRNRINPEYSGPSIKILKESDDFLALEKPHRIHSYPLAYSEKDNTLSFLRSMGKGGMLHAFREFADRNLLFRLDYETAGVLLFYKGSEELKQLRSAGDTKKIYTLLVKGHYETLGSFQNFYSSHGSKGERVRCLDQATPKSRMGELSVLSSVYDSDLDVSLVLVQLHTGVRHQIRSFFSSLGFPILGDPLYGGEAHEKLCLHATYYHIKDFAAYSPPLFLDGDFLNLNSRFEVLRDQFGIS